MTLRFIDADEWHPVYSIEETNVGLYKRPAEFTDEELADYADVMRRFDEWQEKLRDRCGRNSPG